MSTYHDQRDNQGRITHSGTRTLLCRLHWRYGVEIGTERYCEQMSGRDLDIVAWRKLGVDDSHA